MVAFYNQEDQDIYKTNQFMPQSRFLLNAPKPVVEEEEVTESFGIPQTQAFNNSGGNDFSVYNPDPNSIVNRNYNPYPFRQAESPIDEGSDPSYFTPPEPTGLGKIAQFASNFMPGAGIARFAGNYLPPNQRAIMENQLSRQGVMVNNIGQIVQGGGAYDDVSGRNVMAGYNANKMTAETFDKRIAEATKKMSDTNIDPNTGKTYKEARIAALEAGKKKFLDAEDESEEIYDFKKKQKQLNKKNNIINRFFTDKKQKKEDDRKAAEAAAANRAGQIAAEKGANTTTSSDGRGSRRGAADIRESSRGRFATDDTASFFARGGRVGYFFGGRVNFKDGGLASIL